MAAFRRMASTFRGANDLKLAPGAAGASAPAVAPPPGFQAPGTGRPVFWPGGTAGPPVGSPSGKMSAHRCSIALRWPSDSGPRPRALNAWQHSFSHASSGRSLGRRPS